MSYLVNLEKFYGPMDLLLYLIEKEEMDIYDIPIALIADQYIDYVHATGQIDLDNIGDFLIMASYLLNLKSRLLLPGVAADEDDTEIIDPREELVTRILEYKQYKQAGEYLASRYNEDINRVFFRDGQGELECSVREVSSSLNALLQAWFAVLERRAAAAEYELPLRDINIGEKMDFILRLLPANGTTVALQDFWAGITERSEVLAFFLASLELIRMQKVIAYQEHQFGEIKLCLRVALDDVNAGRN